MKQIVPPPEIPNQPEAYSLHISSVYKMKKELIMISELKKADNTTLREKPVSVEVEVDQELPVKHYVILKKEDKVSLVKEKEVDSFNDIRDKVRLGECVYGQDLRSYTDKFLLSIHSIPGLNSKWVKRNLNVYNGVIGLGVIAAAAVGIFAFQHYGVAEKISEKLNNNSNTPNGP